MPEDANPINSSERDLASTSIDGEDGLSVDVDQNLSDRLRSLASTHKFNESEIVHIALTIFFSRGDDRLLGLIMNEFDALETGSATGNPETGKEG